MKKFTIIFIIALATFAFSCSDSADTTPACLWGNCTGGGGGDNPSLDEDKNPGDDDNNEETSGDGDTTDDTEETGDLLTVPLVPKPNLPNVPKPDVPIIPKPIPEPEPDPEPEPEPEPEGDGTYLGKFKWTHYYIVFEGDYPGTPNTNIVDWHDCSIIETVSKAFYDKVAVEGTGFLTDGRLINKYGNCPGKCNLSGWKCFSEVDQSEAPFGHGSHDNPLRPFRSVASDVDVVPFGTKLYVPAIVGMTMPDENDLDPNAPFVHDGCVVAEDEGSSITGKHLDFFVLTETDDNNVIDIIMDGLDEVDVYRDSPKCE